MELKAGSQAIHIASVNMAKKDGRQAIRELTEKPTLRDADILLLQEVVDSAESRVAREVAAALGCRFVFVPAFRLRDGVDEGLAILSRHPIHSSKVVQLPRNSLHFHTRKRIALAATVDTPIGQVRVVNLHLDNRINVDRKLEQLAGVLESLKTPAGPAVIGGDFNTGDFLWVGHLFPLPGLQKQRSMVKAEMEQHGFSTPFQTYVQTLRHLPLQLDWIYARRLEAVDSGMTPLKFSDHNAIWTKLRPDAATASRK